MGAFCLILWVHVALALVTAAVLSLSAFITIVYVRRMTIAFRNIYSRIAEFNALLEENVGGIRVEQAFSNEDHERNLFANNNCNYLSTKLEAYKMMVATMALSHFSMRAVLVVVMLVGAWFVVHGRLTAGEFIGFLLLVNVFFRPLQLINAVIDIYRKDIAGLPTSPVLPLDRYRSGETSMPVRQSKPTRWSPPI